MTVNISNHEFTIIWDGVYNYALSNYPYISDWELYKLLCFIDYERKNGRETKIECDNKSIQAAVDYALSHREQYRAVLRPAFLTACKGCTYKGCLTDFVCHTAPIKNALMIFKSRTLQSAAKWRGISKKQLASESRNAAGDPSDFFDYIMFSWGNCPAGDRLVVERRLGRDPTPDELEHAFTPGVRFYYRFDELSRDKNAVDDGYHALKIRDELKLDDRLTAIIIPKSSFNTLDPLIDDKLRGKVSYLSDAGMGMTEWSKTVYEYLVTIAYDV